MDLQLPLARSGLHSAGPPLRLGAAGANGDRKVRLNPFWGFSFVLSIEVSKRKWPDPPGISVSPETLSCIQEL